MIIKNVRIFNKDSKFEIGDIVIENDRITKVITDEDGEGSLFENATQENDEIIDGQGLMAIPGFVDIHFHGAMGHDFCNADLEGLKEIARYELLHGITSICPATMTFPEDMLKEIMSTVRDFVIEGNAYKHDRSDETDDIDEKSLNGENGYTSKSMSTLVGVNMEGPFISEKKIGAQNPQYVQKPDVGMFERLYEASGRLIKLVDIAPETEGAMEFIEKCKDKVNISIAHTDCDFETADMAFKAGARHVTHLYNAMNPIHHRKPGPIIAALENRAEVELIADGIHVDSAMVRFTFSSFGKDKVILISDSMEATGLPDGEYQLGGQPVIKNGKLATLKDKGDTVAGSVTNLFDCMKTAVFDMGVELERVILSATLNPAKSIGIDGDVGSIEEGKVANILLVDDNLNLKYVINQGHIVE
ncbi:N-acetylglucosamine-6-phosphate deacetylase [Butyrivibrio sp. XBB1001]|uniref:N-acetylglucosamine-6-phosphate deacetylase n=1 Tax=Butyrivibrio sp. XBB1001 TaxID=1280682 RepID=UPI000416173A|nr:N-acetylglucosamine-6-phosphate deacetylase [Butyrivibrio sp. XBB1001]